MTGIRRHRHPERSRGIFTALRESVCMRRGKTMSWCCLTSDDERSAIKTLGYASETLIKSLSDFTLEILYMARNNLTRIASYLRKVMTKPCIKFLVESDSAI